MTYAALPEPTGEGRLQGSPVVRPPAESGELAAGAAPAVAIGVWPGGWSSNSLNSLALDDVLAYQRDFWERAILFWDTLRRRADNMIAHERAEAAAARFRLRTHPRRAPVRAARQLCAAADHPLRRSVSGRLPRSDKTSGHDRRSARRPWSWDRRVQARVRSRDRPA